MEANRITLKTLYISLITLFLVELARALLFSGKQMPLMPVLGISRLIEICCYVFIVIFWGEGLSSIGLAGYQLLPGIKKGLIWSFCFGAIVLLVACLLYISGINPLIYIRSKMPTQKWDLILFFLVGGFIAPVVEEILFRGILFGFFRRWGFIIALLFSSLVFAFAHYPGVSIIQITGGIIFGISYEIEGKLMVPIIIHILANLALFTLSVINCTL